MATANDILKIAQKELGTTEYPANSNKVKYNTWFYGREVSGSAYPWCMAFVQWVFNQGGMKLGCVTAGCTTFMNWAKSTGRWYTSNFQPGDIILYNFDNVSDSEHTGICESWDGIYITAIEGNTSSGNSGSQDNGGGVFRKKRHKSLILGVYRPAYSTASSAQSTPAAQKPATSTYDTTPDTVKEVQIWLNRAYGAGLSEDGKYGSKTRTALIKAAQKAIGATVDGMVGPNTLSKWPVIQKGSQGEAAKIAQAFLICLNYDIGSYGADGQIGSATDAAFRRFQKNNGLSVDGKFGSNSFKKATQLL